MRFSETAFLYLDKLNRDKDYVISDRSNVESYLVRQNLPILKKIVDFQIEYSGLELTIFKKPESTFKAMLFSISEVINNESIEYLKIDAQSFFYCGDHKTAQFWFVISENGEVCTYDNADNTINIIFSSFDKFIETYAFQNLLSVNSKYEHPPYYHLIDRSWFATFTSNYFQHTKANDDYNQWMSLEDFTIHTGTWYDQPSKYLKIYGANKLECEELVKVLLNNKIIR